MKTCRGRVRAERGLWRAGRASDLPSEWMGTKRVWPAWLAALRAAGCMPIAVLPRASIVDDMLHTARCFLLPTSRTLALLYSTWFHQHSCMQICMGTERNGQVGRTYWQAAMRYKVCHVYTCYTPLPVLPRCMLYAASCASVL